jgi:hypothetical protein
VGVRRQGPSLSLTPSAGLRSAIPGAQVSEMLCAFAYREAECAWEAEVSRHPGVGAEQAGLEAAAEVADRGSREDH